MDLTLLARVLLQRARLRQRERWSPERIAAHQSKALGLLRAYAHARSPFYRRFHWGLEHRGLTDLPVVTKAELMSHFDELVTDRALRLTDVRAHLEGLQGDALLLEKYRVARTSGSTGLAGTFVSDAREWATVLASYSRAQEWAGLVVHLTKKLRLAVVSSTVPSHQSARVGASVASSFVPVRRFDATEPLDRIVTSLNDWQPHNLIAYASMLRLLAEEQLSGRLQIAPRAVMSASEVLTHEARRRICLAWGNEPFDVYAATETATIAAECSAHRLHLFEDLVISEVVDDQNRPVPPGEYGSKLLVTVLFSRTQPLIRYEISDRVMLTRERCGCGLPFALVESIEGRAEDILTLPGLERGTVDIHPNVFHDLLEPLPVRAWQVLDEPDQIRILLARPSGTIEQDELSRQVSAALLERGAAAPRVQVEVVDAVTQTTLGKAPLVRARQ